MSLSDLPPEPADVRALRIEDDWWPRMPRTSTFRQTVGVRGADQDSWLRPGPHDQPLLLWRRELLDATGDLTFQALPGAEAAGEQVLALVTAASTARLHDHRRSGRDHAIVRAGAAGPWHPLERAGRLVVEDLCLMDVSGPDPVLVGASLAMPNRWRLSDKLGKNLLDVHAPVPGYAAEIGTATDQLLRRLSGDRIMARTNWGIVDRPDLFQPVHALRDQPAQPDVTTPEQVARLLWVRVEYQTVRAVPQTRSVLFTIRTAREPLGALADRPQVAATLLALIEQQPSAHHDYKGLTPYLTPVLACLRSMAA